jgi:hypothetical protein
MKKLIKNIQGEKLEVRKAPKEKLNLIVKNKE